MPKKFDITDLAILEGLGAHGPRNISRVSRKLGINAETLRKRLKRMPSRVSFNLYTNIYCTNLGLQKAVAIAEAIPGYEDLLLDCLKANDFWIYVSRCYGMNEGCIAVYTVPNNHSAEFVQFIKSLEKSGVARNVQLLWSTCFQSVNSKTKWFDEKLKTWVLPWDSWVEEILTENTKLPTTLVDPESYLVKADETDMRILMELERNPTITLSKLAKIFGISQQLVEYHYQKHILERYLIEGFEVITHHFDISLSDFFIFTFNFASGDKCAKFASSLLDKPFVGGLGKVLGENALIVDIYLPKPDFRNFIDALSKLVRKGWLKSYNYVILDRGKAHRQTISYEYFKNDSWIYDHNKHIRNLKNLIDGVKLERQALPAVSAV